VIDEKLAEKFIEPCMDILGRSKKVINLKKQIVICPSSPKSASFSSELSFLAEAQPRLNRRGQNTILLQRCTLNFLGDPTNCKAKDIIGRIANFFVPIFFK
jgi:hypothetical protein